MFDLDGLVRQMEEDGMAAVDSPGWTGGCPHLWPIFPTESRWSLPSRPQL